MSTVFNPGFRLAHGFTIFPSLARTATPTFLPDQQGGHDSIHVIIDVTVKGGAAPSVVFTIEGKDPASGKYYTILASAAITAVGTTVLRVGRGLTAAANVVANDVIPENWRVNAVHGNADSITYSVGAQYGI